MYGVHDVYDVLLLYCCKYCSEPRVQDSRSVPHPHPSPCGRHVTLTCQSFETNQVLEPKVKGLAEQPIMILMGCWIELAKGR